MTCRRGDRDTGAEASREHGLHSQGAGCGGCVLSKAEGKTESPALQSSHPLYSQALRTQRAAAHVGCPDHAGLDTKTGDAKHVCVLVLSEPAERAQTLTRYTVLKQGYQRERPC